MASNSRAGLVFQPIAALFLGSLSGLPGLHPSLFVFNLLAIVALSIVRGFVIRRFEASFDRDPRRWRTLFFGTLLTSAALIGSMIYISVLEGGLSAAGSFAAMAVATAMASIALTYSLSLAFARTFILILCCAPLAAVLRLQEGETSVRVALAITAFLLYLLIVSRQQHRERWAGLANTHLLALRAAELEGARNDLHRAHSELENIVEERTAALSRLSSDYRRIFDNAHDPIIVFNPEGERVLNVNRRACEIYGFSREEFLGMSMIDISLTPERGRLQVEETLQKGVYHNFESCQRRKDGSVMFLEINASTIDYEGRPAILSINRDITERRKAEEMRLAKEAAERADRAKSQFLANMSHEIRTPMAGILGLSDLLLKTELNPRQRRYSELIQSSTTALLGVIDDILDFARIEADKLTLESVPFHLSSMLTEAVDLLKLRAQAKGIGLELTVEDGLPEWCVGDPGRLRQAVINLVGNAVKFTDQGAVEVCAQLAADGRIQIAVVDTGVGIPPAIQEKLFTPFSQADSSTSRRFGGSGLGLAITKRIVEMMGGEMSFTSQPGTGSSFWFAVSLQRTAPPEAGNAGGKPAGGTAPPSLSRVLVAEDNPVNQLVVLEQLASLGFEATAVSNGLEALAALEERPYDLVLMDCQMPELDGYETTLRMRQREGERWEVPVIALTAHAMQGDREKCLAAGMNDYISKPFRVETLRQIIQRWLASSPADTAASLPEPPPSSPPPAAASVDPEALERLRALGRAAGRDLLRQMVDTFRSRPHLEELREAMTSGDLKSLELRAHSLKGSAGTLGARRLAELCSELEHGARGDGAEPVAPRIDTLEEEYHQVLAELTAAAAVPE